MIGGFRRSCIAAFRKDCRTLHAEDLRDARLTQIGIDKQCRQRHLRESQGKITGKAAGTGTRRGALIRNERTPWLTAEAASAVRIDRIASAAALKGS